MLLLRDTCLTTVIRYFLWWKLHRLLGQTFVFIKGKKKKKFSNSQINSSLLQFKPVISVYRQPRKPRMNQPYRPWAGCLGNNVACKELGDTVDSKLNMSQQHTLAAKVANSIPCA